LEEDRTAFRDALGPGFVDEPEADVLARADDRPRSAVGRGRRERDAAAAVARVTRELEVLLEGAIGLPFRIGRELAGRRRRRRRPGVGRMAAVRSTETPVRLDRTFGVGRAVRALAAERRETDDEAGDETDGPEHANGRNG